MSESEADYYSRLDREFEASPYTQAARVLAEHDETCQRCRHSP